MTLAQQTHPTPEQLAEYSRGKLSVADDQQIESHLSECDKCAETLNQLPDDTLVALLRDKSPDTGRQPTLAVDAAPTATNDDAVLSLSLPAELDRYRIVELIGAGGMGAVYKAEHRMMQRTVALKVIDPRLIDRPGAVERFHREVQAAARLSHPNIVTSHDADHVGDLHFLVMEFVDGIDLADVVKQRGRLPVEQACNYIRQAAFGLQHAHEEGMVHRDIKPHNLMLTPGRGRMQTIQRDGELPNAASPSTPGGDAGPVEPGTIKILDFGLASLATETIADARDDGEMANRGESSQLTMAGTLMGTPDYMSPEQASDARGADIRSDIYALGATLYYLLAAKPPFAEGTVMQKLEAHRNLDPQPIETLRADVPVELAKVIHRMMAKDPADRFATPAQVADALAPFVDRYRSGPIAGPQYKAAQYKAAQYKAAQYKHSDPWPRRAGRRRLAVAVLTLLLLVAAAGAVVYVAGDKGTLQIRGSQDVDIVVRQDGEIVEIIDHDSGQPLVRLRSGTYEIEPKNDNDQFTLSKDQFVLRRGQRVIVDVRRVADVPLAQPPRNVNVLLHRATTASKTITQDGVVADDGAWRIETDQARTVRLFDVPITDIDEGLLTYRARLKTKNLEGRAYLEMWVRLPGRGEFFSKGLYQAVSGSKDWAEYEIPFKLEKGQAPDLAKLNLVVEGKGTAWIKDVELRATIPAAASTRHPARVQNGPANLAGLQFVTRDFVAAVVIHPQEILDKPIADSAKLYLASLFEQDLGVEMKDVEQLLLLMPDLAPSHPRRVPTLPFAAVIRFTDQVDAAAMLNQILIRPEKVVQGKSTFYVDDQGNAALIPDKRTVVRAPRDLLVRMAESSQPDGLLADQLRTADLRHDVVAVITNAGFIRQSLFVGAATMQPRLGPELASDIGQAPNAVLAAELSLNLNPGARISLTLNASGEGSAELIQRLTEQSLEEARTALIGLGATKVPEQTLDPNQLTLRIAFEILRTARVARRENDVIVNSLVPAGLADSILAGVIMKSRRAVGEAKWKNQLKQVGLAMHNYHDTHKGFPPAQHAPAEQFDKSGNPLLSWRVYLLPFISDDAARLYSRFRLDEPWNSEHNLALLDEMPDVFRTTRDSGKTTILAVVGGGTGYEGKRGRRLRDITDGTSNTIMAVIAGDDKAVPWTKPEDLPLNSDDPINAFGNLPGEAFQAVFFDGSVRAIRKDLDPATLRALLICNDGLQIDASNLQRDHGEPVE